MFYATKTMLYSQRMTQERAMGWVLTFDFEISGFVTS